MRILKSLILFNLLFLAACDGVHDNRTPGQDSSDLDLDLAFSTLAPKTTECYKAVQDIVYNCMQKSAASDRLKVFSECYDRNMNNIGELFAAGKVCEGVKPFNCYKSTSSDVNRDDFSCDEGGARGGSVQKTVPPKPMARTCKDLGLSKDSGTMMTFYCPTLKPPSFSVNFSCQEKDGQAYFGQAPVKPNEDWSANQNLACELQSTNANGSVYKCCDKYLPAEKTRECFVVAVGAGGQFGVRGQNNNDDGSVTYYCSTNPADPKTQPTASSSPQKTETPAPTASVPVMPTNTQTPSPAQSMPVYSQTPSPVILTPTMPAYSYTPVP